MAKTDVIVAKAQKRSEHRKAEVLTVIAKMRRQGKKVTFYSVQKTTGASKSYFYGNAEIRSAIESARASPCQRTPSNKDALIKFQKARIEALEQENKHLKAGASESYKAKYEALLTETESLRKQLRTAYTY